jgi:SPP1 gp7 family putative phage head morphogenesis protein
MDPSRTVLIRRQFEAEVKRRLRELKREIEAFLVTEDELGLQEHRGYKLNWSKREVNLCLKLLHGDNFAANARRYEFLTNDRKLETFNEWLQTMIDGKVLGVGRGENAWTAKYITSAYRQGINRAYIQGYSTKLSKQVDFLTGTTRAQFLRSTFNQPELASKVRLLGTRTFNGMEGFTRSMKSDLNRILADGLVNGRSARKIARDMYQRIDGLTKSRALTIARTEVIHAQAEGQLDGLQALGIESVTAEVEWSTAGDELVCPRCAAMNGKEYTIDEARGLIPLHPNCRCAWIPVEPKLPKQKSKG